MLGSMQFNSGRRSTDVPQNCFNSLQIGHHHPTKFESIDKYTGVNMTGVNNVTLNHTKENCHLGIINNHNHNNNNNNISTTNNRNNNNNNNDESKSVAFYFLKTLNNNNTDELAALAKTDATNKTNQLNCDRVENDSGGDTNELDTDDVFVADAERTIDGHHHRSKGDDKAPDHHARRPMNAFLIFCKRHRAIVREKYPNLENRSVTKILGDWWANLDEADKTCYSDLAKQYKDAFFSANPNFKWYKLPAPPIRSASIQTRLVDDGHLDASDGEPMAKRSHSSSSSSMEFDQNTQSTKSHQRQDDATKTDVSLFKLADETQMGGLNSLMMAVAMVNNNSKSLNSNDDHRMKFQDPIEQNEYEKQNALHRALGETRSFMERKINGFTEDSDIFSTVPNQQQQPHSQLEQNISENHIPSKVDVVKQNYIYAPSTDNDLHRDNSPGDIGDHPKSMAVKKSARACKGKRYAEFMKMCKSNPVVRKTKSTPMAATLSPIAIEQSNNRRSANAAAYHQMDYENCDHLYANHTTTVTSPTTPFTHNGSDCAANKFFDANDFDLEAKIKALPGRCLDTYLSLKRDVKKKKYFHGKRLARGDTNRKCSLIKKVSAVPMRKSSNGWSTKTNFPAAKTIQEAKQRMMMVGSQKRKARKESITRREVDPIIALAQGDSTTATIATSKMQSTQASFTSNRINVMNCPSGCADLLILATMAEEVANSIV